MLFVTIGAYFFSRIGFFLSHRVRTLGDQLPWMRGQQARVANAREFSSSTVATTISLATVVLAFFEMAPYFGLWLAWTIMTTVLGMLALRLAARRIWQRMETYQPHHPTLHEFLGQEYGTSGIAWAGAACTSLGVFGRFCR